MSFVGIDIDRCVELKAHLDQACRDLNAHADTVRALLAQAGIVSCQAVAELRDVAAWADYRARDLQKRIDRARAADSGVPPGSRFGGSERKAEEAGIAEAKRLKDILSDPNPDPGALNAELARIKGQADDPAYAAALVRQLGSKFLDLLKRIDDPSHPRLMPDALAALATLLATVSRTAPFGDKALKVVKNVLDNATAAELATLLQNAQFDSGFTAKAAQVVLTKYTRTEIDSAWRVGLGDVEEQYRQAAISALQRDPTASFLFVKDASKGDAAALRSLLEEPKDTGILTNAFARYKHDANDDDCRVVLGRVIKVIGSGVPKMSGGEKQDMAAALRPSFLNGDVTKVADHNFTDAGKLAMGVNDTELEKCLAALMSDKTARAMLIVNAGDYVAKVIAKDVDKLEPHLLDNTQVDLNHDGKAVGALYTLMDDAMSDAMNQKIDKVNIELAIIGSAGHTLGSLGVAATGVTGGASTVAGAGAGLMIDQGVDAYKKDRLEAIKVDFGGAPGNKPKEAVTVALVQALKDRPEYKGTFTGPYAKLIDPKTGELKTDNQYLLNGWLLSQKWTLPDDPDRPAPPGSAQLDRLSDLQAPILIFTDKG